MEKKGTETKTTHAALALSASRALRAVPVIVSSTWEEDLDRGNDRPEDLDI